MGAAHSGAGSRNLRDTLPVVEGAVAGGTAYVVGLILTFLLLTVDGEVDLGASEQVGALDEVGWFFYSAHLANIETSLTVAGESRTSSANLVTEASTQLPEVIFYLVPVLVLTGVGYAVVPTLDGWNPSVADCAVSGATVVVGYLPLTLVGVFLFTASTSTPGGEASVGPDLLTSILLVGLLFPLLFGAAGGALYSQVE